MVVCQVALVLNSSDRFVFFEAYTPRLGLHVIGVVHGDVHLGGIQMLD